MNEQNSWWPTSTPEQSDTQAMTDGALIAAHQAGRTIELLPEEQARLAEILELQHSEAFTQPED